MHRCTRAFLFVLASTTLAACSSSGSGGSGTGGTGGSASGASGGPSASGGTTALSNAGSSTSPGGSSTIGGGGATGGAGGQTSSRSTSAIGGSSAIGGAGGQSSTGGTSAIGGNSAGGQASAGGMSGSGGSGSRSTAGGTSAIGGNSSGGIRSSGGTTGGTTASSGVISSAKCPDTTWKLVWGDDFEGSAGTAVDGSKWAYDSGPNWYNGELQDYTTGTTNASLDGSGNLVIEARKEAREGRQYTSARLKTEGKKTFTYGRIEGRMKVPYGQGMWPAFWMLGGNNWPNSGEIDIMENLGREPSIIHGTFHGPGYSGAAGPSASYTLPGDGKFSDDFHVFAIEWETDAIRWYVDGHLYSTKTKADIQGKTWVFDHGFFIILNLAVGGEWPGNPDATTVFPQKFVIDYVHACQK